MKINHLLALSMILIALLTTCGYGSSTEGALPIMSNTEETNSSPDRTFFPLGFMGAYSKTQNEDSLPKIAEGGFNIVHEFRGVQEIKAAQDYLVWTEEAGLSVIQNMPACRAYTQGQSPCQEHPVDAWNEEEWGTFISELSMHDNLVAWFLPDEITDYAAAADLYRWVQKYDPKQRPVYGNPGTFDYQKIARFPQFSDFLWAACYPEYYGEPRAIVTYGMRLDARAAQGTDTRWGAILQFFDSAEFGKEPSYPTPRELRCDSYQAIIAGATGLWYFAYELGADLDGLGEELEIIADEIIGSGELDQVILSPDVPQTIRKSTVSGPARSPRVHRRRYDSIQTLQKELDGIYLFAVNIGVDTVLVEFGNLPAGITEVEVLFEAREVPVVEGEIRDSFAPCDVHIYRVATGSAFSPSP